MPFLSWKEGAGWPDFMSQSPSSVPQQRRSNDDRSEQLILNKLPSVPLGPSCLPLVAFYCLGCLVRLLAQRYNQSNPSYFWSWLPWPSSAPSGGGRYAALSLLRASDHAVCRSEAEAVPSAQQYSNSRENPRNLQYWRRRGGYRSRGINQQLAVLEKSRDTKKSRANGDGVTVRCVLWRQGNTKNRRQPLIGSAVSSS